MKAVAITVLSCLIVLIPIVGKGQCPSDKGQIEIVVSYGVITGDEISQKNTSSDNSQFNKKIVSNSGAPFLTVRYFLYNRLAFGFSGGSTDERLQYTDPFNPSWTSGNYKQRSTTVALELYYVYFFRKYIEVYTLAGFGPSFISTEEPVFTSSTNTFTTVTTSHDVLKVQYTPIGVRIGGRLGVFAELGIGYKGVFNAGASFKLGPSCWWKG